MNFKPFFVTAILVACYCISNVAVGQQVIFSTPYVQMPCTTLLTLNQNVGCSSVGIPITSDSNHSRVVSGPVSESICLSFCYIGYAGCEISCLQHLESPATAGNWIPCITKCNDRFRDCGAYCADSFGGLPF